MDIFLMIHNIILVTPQKDLKHKLEYLLYLSSEESIQEKTNREAALRSVVPDFLIYFGSFADLVFRISLLPK
jgi:hypothetical protein